MVRENEQAWRGMSTTYLTMVKRIVGSKLSGTQQIYAYIYIIHAPLPTYLSLLSNNVNSSLSFVERLSSFLGFDLY